MAKDYKPNLIAALDIPFHLPSCCTREEESGSEGGDDEEEEEEEKPKSKKAKKEKADKGGDEVRACPLVTCVCVQSVL